MAGEDELRRQGQAQGQSGSGSRRRGGRSGRGRRGHRRRPSPSPEAGEKSSYSAGSEEVPPADYLEGAAESEHVEQQAAPLEEESYPGPSETADVLRECSEPPADKGELPETEPEVEAEAERKPGPEPDWSEVQETFSAPPEALPVQRPSTPAARPHEPQSAHRVQSRPERQEHRRADAGAVQRAIEDATEIIRTLEAALEDMQEVLETLELAERQKQVDEHEIESLRRALRHLQRPREGGASRR